MRDILRRLTTLGVAASMVGLAAGCDEEERPETAAAPEPTVGATADTTGAAGAAQAPEGTVRTDRDDVRVVRLEPVAIRLVDYLGIAVSDTATVDEVISDRAFWMRAGEGRVLGVVREDVPQHEMIDIDAGQRLRFEGLVLGPEAVEDLTGTLEDETRQAILAQPGFVAMYWKDVQIL